MLPIDVLKLDKLIATHQIDKNFEFVNNKEVMYYAIQKDYELINLLNEDVGHEIVRLFVNDKTLDKELRKELFFRLIKFFQRIPSDYISLIETEEEYVKLASQSFMTYLNLYEFRHPYKDKEKELFFSLYEDNYVYNPDYTVFYAKQSSKVLLKTLKTSPLNIYYLSFFTKEAVSTEVINYLSQSNLIDSVNNPSMYISPKIKFLKLKRDINFWSSLMDEDIDENVINYLKQVNFNQNFIEEYLKNHKKYPDCLKNPNLILMLLEQDLANIKYYTEDNPNEQVIQYLNNHEYLYQINHNSNLLKDMTIYKRFLDKGNINLLLRNNICLNNEQLELLLQKIISNNLDYRIIQNKYLLNNNYFCDKICKYYNIDNPYHLESKHLISNLGSSLNQLRKIFNDEEIQIIIREIIKNDYFINLVSILDKIDVYKFNVLYNRLYRCESIFDVNFNFYNFIKVMEYFQNNFALLDQLNKSTITDELIHNLSLAINRNDYVDYQELVNYQIYCQNKIEGDNCNIKSKIFKLLVNGDYEAVGTFLTKIADTKKLLYLQLTTSNKAVYQLLELYLNMIGLLENVYYNDIDVQLFQEIKEKMTINSLFDLKVMQDNILKIYALSYQEEGIKHDILLNKGKGYEVNGTLVFDISEEDFVLFVHTEEFNTQDDSTTLDYEDAKRGKKNYLCTSFASELFPYGMDDTRMQVYELDNIASLLAFGNKDIFINPTKPPLFEAENQFVNSIDMAFIHGYGYTPTEFDFLRYDNHNKPKTSSYKVVKSKEEAEKLATSSKDVKRILIFDVERNKVYIEQKFNYYCDNVFKLTFKELYKLIALSKKFEISSQVKENIYERISELSEKERIVLQDALIKYRINKVNGKTY